MNNRKEFNSKKYYNKRNIDENNEDLIVKDGKIKENARIIVTCDNLSHEGVGIAHIDGELTDGTILLNFPIFVAGMVPTEKGIVRIKKIQSNLAKANLEKLFVETYSSERVDPVCKHYGDCGGCNLMHMSYNSQLLFKHQMVCETLAKLGNLKDVQVKDIIPMKNPFEYRNKVQFPVGVDYYKKTIVGFYKRDSHDIVKIDKCYIQGDMTTEISNFIKNLANQYQIKGYNEKYHEGLLRYILLKTNYDNSELMIVLVTLEKNFPFIKEIIEKILARYPQVTSIMQNINFKRGNMILGEENILLYGNRFITDKLCNNYFKIGASSFYQVNKYQTEVLYNKAIELANLTRDDIVIDAYCGIGTIGIICSWLVKKVYSVEIVEEAIENAKDNAVLNDVQNIEFICNKAEDQIKIWHKTIKPTVLFVDPPRKGCESEFLESIVDMNISKIVYISCNPATLARDLKFLVANNYDISEVVPVDMFPYTNHVETIVCLSRK